MEDLLSEKKKYRQLLLKRAKGEWWTTTGDGVIAVMMILATVSIFSVLFMFFITGASPMWLLILTCIIIGSAAISQRIDRVSYQVKSLIELIGEDKLLEGEKAQEKKQ